MKVALLCYHKNAETIYRKEWINSYRSTIQSQILYASQDFEIFEFNYGGGAFRIFENSYFESFPYPTFAHALNYLLDKAFSAGYDAVFNSNVDDFYNIGWMQALLPCIQSGNDLVSCNFTLIGENDETIKPHLFHGYNVAEQLSGDHNIICHPGVCYSKKFWESNRYVPSEMPLEDLKLWQRAVQKGMKLYIHEENLVFHRLHNQSVCQSENK